VTERFYGVIIRETERKVVQTQYDELFAMWDKSSAATPFPKLSIERVLKASCPSGTEIDGIPELKRLEGHNRVKRCAECYIEFLGSAAGQAFVKRESRPVYLKQTLKQVADHAQGLRKAIECLGKDAEYARARTWLPQAERLAQIAAYFDRALRGISVPYPDEETWPYNDGPIETLSDERAIARAMADRRRETDQIPDINDDVRLRTKAPLLGTTERLRSAEFLADTLLNGDVLDKTFEDARVGQGQRPRNAGTTGIIRELALIYAMIQTQDVTAKLYETGEGPRPTRYLKFVWTCFDEMHRVAPKLVKKSHRPSESTIKRWSVKREDDD
jgi:hypothetical protein